MPTNQISEFITNKDGNTLSGRLNELVSKTENLDILVGYFYISGFYQLYKNLEEVDKIRILIGLNTEAQVVDAVQGNLEIPFESAKKVKDSISKKYIDEVAAADDDVNVEEGMLKFVEWLQSGKLQIKIYDKAPLHAKLYIFTFNEGQLDPGRVITGSSNLTRSGLKENLEFNVELKNSNDYKFALENFNALWDEAIELSETLNETITKKTHLNEEITPYQLYLKFLYEYFREDLTADTEIEDYIPDGYLELEYQKQAVVNAKKIIEEYGGVFISDVVGLGKTYITARLLNVLGGKTLVIASPALIAKDNPGSWTNVLMDFGVRGFECESVGMLEKILERGVDKFDNVVIDESHNFRNEATLSFERLTEICRGKKVVLVSATPFNNKPSDLLAQIKLFQNSRKSTIPGVPNLEAYFSSLKSRIGQLSRRDNYEQYMEVAKSNAQDIRNNILKYLMVRRTRSEIEKYYSDDLKKQGLKFPEVHEPEPIFYQLDSEEEGAFNKTISFIENFKYSRYIPLLYYTGELTEQERISQRNMLTFMKMLLLKRFESSVFAFKKTLKRFIRSYELMIDQFDKGNVYVSKKRANKVFQLLEENRIEELMDLIEQEKVEFYKSEDFNKNFRKDLEYDLSLLRNLDEIWENIDRDVKFETFVEKLKSDKILSNNKLIIFTESKETANYLSEKIEERLNEKVLNYTGDSATALRADVIKNFDAKAPKKENIYRILVTTEVLAEGVNLHQSNVVINYDIPWNPTRLMQRVGRINRVDTKFKDIYTYNIFPSLQSNDILKLKEAAEAKIQMFIELLGNDARLLTEGEEIKSNELFDKLSSKETIIGETEEDSELKYLTVIKDIRDKNVELFSQIKNLPKKSRSARRLEQQSGELLTYFKKGKLDKFIISGSKEPRELGFLEAIKLFECKENTQRVNIPSSFYKQIKKNKEYFGSITSEEGGMVLETRTGALDRKILKRLNANTVKRFDGFTEEQEEYLEIVKQKIDEGALPKNSAKRIWGKMKNMVKPLEIVSLLQKEISPNLLKDTHSQAKESVSNVKEVILSEYFE
jgi:superfamily II DNA/RNA helicase